MVFRGPLGLPKTTDQVMVKYRELRDPKSETVHRS